MVESGKKWFKVTGTLREDIHADIEAENDEEAVVLAMKLFELWVENRPATVDGVTFGPDEVEVLEDLVVTEALSPAWGDQRYWSEAKEFIVYRDKGGELVVHE